MNRVVLNKMSRPARADWTSVLRILLLVPVLFLGAFSCASLSELGRQSTRPSAPAVDSLTLGLWHLDEMEGDIAGDVGPFQLGGVVGYGATVTPGRAGMARRFSGELDGFVVASRSWPRQDLEALTVEAYVRVSETSTGGLETIAAQWTGRDWSSSWYFGLAGPSGDGGLFSTADASPRALVFAYVRAQRRADQAVARLVVSEKPILPGVWTHVAVTFDGRSIRFYRDHAPDLDPTQDVELEIEDGKRLPDRIQGVDTPVTIGVFLENPTTARSGALTNSVYGGVAFNGDLDEVRVSRGVRSDLVKPLPTR